MHAPERFRTVERMALRVRARAFIARAAFLGRAPLRAATCDPAPLIFFRRKARAGRKLLKNRSPPGSLSPTETPR